jgi:hypothetical protein
MLKLKNKPIRRFSDLDMAVLGDDLEAVEVGAHLAHVVDHRGNSKDGGMTAIVLKKPSLRYP